MFYGWSWKENWAGGTGFVLELNGELQVYGSHGVTAGSPLHAEAIALLQGCEFA